MTYWVADVEQQEKKIWAEKDAKME